MRKHLLVIFLIAWLAVTAWARPLLSGNWSLDQTNGSGSLQIRQDGSVLSGTATFPGMAPGQVNGSLQGNRVRFVITWSSQLHGVYEATLSADGLQMVQGTTYPQEGGGSATFTATRRDSASLSGTWTLNQSNGSGSMQIQHDGKVLSGTATFPGMAPGRINGSVEGRRVRFVVTWNANLHGIYEATLSPDGQQMLSGVTRPQEGGGSANFTATKR